MIKGIIDGVQVRCWGRIDNDVSQDCWLRVLRVLPTARLNASKGGAPNLFAWLSIVAKHQTWQKHRREKNRKTVPNGSIEWLQDDPAQVQRYSFAIEPPLQHP